MMFSSGMTINEVDASFTRNCVSRVLYRADAEVSVDVGLPQEVSIQKEKEEFEKIKGKLCRVHLSAASCKSGRQ